MKKKIYVFAMLTLLSALSLSGCRSKEKMDLSGVHDTVPETMAGTAETSENEKETEKSTEAADSTGAGEQTGSEETKKGSDSAQALSVRSKIATEKNGKVSVEYPILSNLKNADMEKKVNDLIKEKALQVVNDYEIDPETDTVQIACNIISLDRSQVVITYEGSLMADGASHPLNLFYTTTVDLGTGSLKGLSDYADSYTLAGYILSEDCTIYQASDKNAALAELQIQDINDLWDTLKKCDFTGADSEGFPPSFSYENQGSIYVSLPVIHALGDYVIVVYAPDTK